jgi:hypothetical protein
LIFHFLNALDFDRQQRMSLGADGFDFIMKSLDQLDLQAF